MGNLVDSVVWRYDLRPVENKAIDKLSLVWDVIQEDEIILFQRNRKYNSIQEFLTEFEKEDSRINIDELLLYNYDLQKEYILKDYVSNKEFNSIDVSLRGSYQFYTYIKDEDLDFNFSIIDLNENRNEDGVEIIIFYENQVIESVELEDDGVVNDNGDISEERVVNLKSVNLPEGAYKIEVKANNDIVTTNIKTKQKKVSFLNKLWFYNDEVENIDIFTDSDYLQFNTVNPEGLQKVLVDDKDIEIKETYNQYAVDVSGSTSTTLTKIYLEKDGIIVSGNGLFSFERDKFFNPVVKRFNSNVDINKENINYILADYDIPETVNGWKTATQEFVLKGSYREFYKYGYIVSVPGLDYEDGVDDYIEIEEIKFELEGRSLFEKMKEVLGLSFYLPATPCSQGRREC
jgi:hypothetical protein